MIYKLRRKMILISAVSILAVFAIIYVAIYIIGSTQLNNMMDTLTDLIAANDGYFPDNPPSLFGDWFSAETQYSTRFFTVWVDSHQMIIRENIESISSVSTAQIQEYTQAVLKQGSARGWIEDYRYKAINTGYGALVVFVSGGSNRAVIARLMWVAFLVLAASSLIIMGLIIFFSERAMRPIAESYDKQKQFITDANHELKTPLTLILSNVDIVESELGKSEWLDDIRIEGARMGELIGQLVTLSRMDEDNANLSISSFDLSTALEDTVSDFSSLAAERGKIMLRSIDPNIIYDGDEGLLRRLFAILLDNAVKYCDSGGEIRVSASAKRRVVITVENTYSCVDKLELDRLFDRFYRADKARTYTGSFGVGLSIARSIVGNHRGDITAYKNGSETIGFRVVLK